MKYQFDVEKIVSRLEKYKADLPTLYKWNAKLDKLTDLGILTVDELKDLKGLTAYDREIELKGLICEKLKFSEAGDQALFQSLCLWIIKDWGGITGAKDDTNTMKLIGRFLKDSKSFERIASVSKIAAFLRPDTHVIYDARVAYALNWFILSDDAGEKFFPIPEGRNSKMNAFDLNVLIRLKHIDKYQTEQESGLDKAKFISNIDKDLFIPASEAYSTLNQLVRLISDQLWHTEAPRQLYYTEMLLFSLADRQIFREITDSISLNINSAIEQIA